MGSEMCIRDRHKEEAIKAAVEVRKKIRAMINEKKFGSFEGSISIGICSGEMLVGNIGSKSLKRFDYTVLGHVVNTAARLEALASSDQILILDSYHNTIKDTFKCAEVGTFKLKNIEDSVNVYNVIE